MNATKTKKKLTISAAPIFVVLDLNVSWSPLMQFEVGGPSVTFLKKKKSPGEHIPLHTNDDSK